MTLGPRSLRKYSKSQSDPSLHLSRATPDDIWDGRRRRESAPRCHMTYPDEGA